FSSVIMILENMGARYCIIGGHAVNTYVEPVYTVDADFIVAADKLEEVINKLQEKGFKINQHPYTINAQKPGSMLLVQFTIDPTFQKMIENASPRQVMEQIVSVASLSDLVQMKLAAWRDPKRRASKRAKDELDLLRIAEKYQEY